MSKEQGGRALVRKREAAERLEVESELRRSRRDGRRSPRP
jgi:hypothetical protein